MNMRNYRNSESLAAGGVVYKLQRPLSTHQGLERISSFVFLGAHISLGKSAPLLCLKRLNSRSRTHKEPALSVELLMSLYRCSVETVLTYCITACRLESSPDSHQYSSENNCTPPALTGRHLQIMLPPQGLQHSEGGSSPLSLFSLLESATEHKKPSLLPQSHR